MWKRQRSEEGSWHRSHGSDEDEEGWWHQVQDKDDDSWWRNDDDSWGDWECLECVNVNLFVSVSVRVVTHMWQGCDSPLVAGLRLATCGRVATRHTCYTSMMTSTAYVQ